MQRITKSPDSFKTALILSVSLHLLFLLTGWRSTFGDSLIKGSGDKGFITVALVESTSSSSETSKSLPEGCVSDTGMVVLGENFLPAEHIQNQHIEQGGGSIENPYLAVLRQKIIKAKRYPRRAQMLSMSGKTQIYFSVRSDGNVENIRIINGSGHAVLDKESCRAIKRASPFPPIPSNIEDDHLDIALTLHYEL
ncbi:MAG: energy transducer TonB [bacterium]